MPRTVIAVASGVGGGKSTLARALARALGERDVLVFDHFEQITARPPAEIRQWMLSGADPNVLSVAGLAQALHALKAGHPVRDPLTGADLIAERHVIFEAPFGRWHAASGVHIDLLVWIDTPLDIALARKLRQLLGSFEVPADTLKSWLSDYLTNYLDLVESLLRLQRERVRPHADIVIDGLQSPEDMARSVVKAMSACSPADPLPRDAS
jgi:uridine kinase